jgi:DNA-binding ferritin-like protein
MATQRVNAPQPERTPRRVASTPDGRENQLVNLAVDLAERQLREGTASAQVLSHYLKAGSSREYLEKQRIAMDVELMKAKQEQIASMARIEELYSDAIGAMRAYQGTEAVDQED